MPAVPEAEPLVAHEAAPRYDGKKARSVAVNVRVDEAPAHKCNPPSERLGLVLMLFQALSVAATTALFRAALAEYLVPAWQVTFLRGASITLLAACTIPCVCDFRSEMRVSRPALVLLVTRGIMGGLTYAFYIYSIAYLPAGDASGLHMTYAVCTAVLSACLLREMLSGREIAAVLVAVIGVCLVTDPSESANNAAAASARLQGTLLGLLSSCTAAVGAVATRGLGERVSFSTAVLSHGTFSSVIGLAGMMLGIGVAPGPQATARMAALHAASPLPAPPGPVVVGAGAVVACVAGAIGFLGECAYARALQVSRAGPVALIASLNVPLVYVFGLLFLGETPHLAPMVGSALAIAAGAYFMVAADRKAEAAERGDDGRAKAKEGRDVGDTVSV